MRAVRAGCLLTGVALMAGAGVWVLAPFLRPPAGLVAAGPLPTVVSVCAWLLLLCLAWLLLGFLAAVLDLLRDRRPGRPVRRPGSRPVLTPAFVRRFATVCVGVGLAGSVTGVASAQPADPSPGPPAGSARLLEGLVVPDRVEGGPRPASAPGLAPAPAPAAPPARTPAARPAPAPGPAPPATSKDAGEVPRRAATPTPASAWPAPSQAPSQTPSQTPSQAPTQAPGAAPTATPTQGGAQDRPPPAAAAPDRRAPHPAAHPAGGRVVVVRPGDSLWTIVAARLPGEASPAAVDATWRRVYAANRPPLGADPDLIHPGDVLRIPRDLASDLEEFR